MAEVAPKCFVIENQVVPPRPWNVNAVLLVACGLCWYRDGGRVAWLQDVGRKSPINVTYRRLDVTVAEDNGTLTCRIIIADCEVGRYTIGNVLEFITLHGRAAHLLRTFPDDL